MVISSALLANYIGVIGFFILTSFSSILFAFSFLLNFNFFFFCKNTYLLELGLTSKFPGLNLNLTIYVDYISYSFGLLTTLISICVYFYAFSYMRFERNIINFLVFFKLFG